VLDFKDSLWHKPGETILKEFYKSAGKEPPAWLELVAEQNAVQESNEEKHFDLVGFLRHIIQEEFKKNTTGISEMKVNFRMKIDDCITKGFVPFLYEHKRNRGGEVEVVITANILSELKRYNRSQTNSNYTLAALASEIPGFKVDQRKINGENKKVACGSKTKFYEFLTPHIQEVDE
jgi:adenylate cyclase